MHLCIYAPLIILPSTCALQMNACLAHEAAQMPTSQGCLLVTETMECIQEVYFVLENKILATISKKREAVPALFAIFMFFILFFQ